jgi:hypothetical protein
MNQLSQPNGANITLDSSSQLAYNFVFSGGPIKPYPRIAPGPPIESSWNVFHTRQESSPLSEEDFVVRRPSELVGSSDARSLFESATTRGRASQRDSLEDSESNSEFSSNEEPDGEQQDESSSSSQEENIRNDE